MTHTALFLPESMLCSTHLDVKLLRIFALSTAFFSNAFFVFANVTEITLIVLLQLVCTFTAS